VTLAAIHTTGLTKSFGTRRALIDLNLDIAPGLVFGYLGPNGAGKTTTIKLLVGLYRPSAGQAMVFATDATKDRDRVQRMIGYLPGDFLGYADQTGEQFLRLIGALRGGVDWANVIALADRFDLDLGRRMGTLSHGNRQKVGIIQAFMHDPPLLILDEPTQGLDPLMQREFLALVRESRTAGRTILLSSHVLSEVESVADQVGILKEGRLLATLSMKELHESALHRIDLHFDGHVPDGPIRAADGVREVQVVDHTAHVTVAGSTAALLRAASPFGVVDIATHETDLADAFLGFYRSRGEEEDEHRLSEGIVGPAPQPSLLG
jgi:ABC-2 type transport system ATP-binding protein